VEFNFQISNFKTRRQFYHMIREKERSAVEKNDEKLISHGESYSRGTEIRRTNPIDSQDDY